MPVNITMPALSPTMEEGNLAKWLVKEGDSVSAGDVIAEIETDKATMEVEAVEEGTIAKLLVEAGTENVKVNAVIAVLAEEGEDAGEIEGAISHPVEPATQQPAPPPDEIDPPVSEAKRSDDHGNAHGKPSLSAERQREPKADKGIGNDEMSAPTANGAGGRVFATPLARRIAKERGLDLARVQGSGPHGRIVKSDVEGLERADSAVTQPPEQTASTPKRPQVPAMADDKLLAMFDGGSFEKKPHDGMRRTIAERLTQSVQTVPSYTITVECALDALLAMRSEMNGAAPVREEKPAYKISVNDFIVKALAKALQDVPMANASWTSTDRLLHRHSDVGVAVAVEDGLFTPIVRRAEEKSLSAISAEVKELAKRARAKKLKPAEYQGGTTAVSNLGMFGVKEFTSIINPPHASILSIGAGEQRPVVREGALAVGTVMAATFAFDHRVIDGALGAELAAAFRGYVEAPMAMLA